ncbi:pyruvate synthase subunit beta, partial [Acidianus hospitalis]
QGRFKRITEKEYKALENYVDSMWDKIKKLIE